jgi:hypothetical protein
MEGSLKKIKEIKTIKHRRWKLQEKLKWSIKLKKLDLRKERCCNNRWASTTFSLQFVQDKCDLLNSFQVGEVKIDINLRGREWTNAQGETGLFQYYSRLENCKITSWFLQQDKHHLCQQRSSVCTCDKS